MSGSLIASSLVFPMSHSGKNRGYLILTRDQKERERLRGRDRLLIHYLGKGHSCIRHQCDYALLECICGFFDEAIYRKVYNWALHLMGVNN